MSKPVVTEVRPGVLVDATGVNYFSAASLSHALDQLLNPGPAPEDPHEMLACLIGGAIMETWG
jgi:hypothetical protein